MGQTHMGHLSIMGYHQGEGGSAPEMWCVGIGVQKVRLLGALGSIAGACVCVRASLRASHCSIPPAWDSSSQRWAREEGSDGQLWSSPKGPVLGDAVLSKAHPSECLGNGEPHRTHSRLGVGCP